MPTAPSASAVIWVTATPFWVAPAGVRPVLGSVKVLVVRPLPVVMNGPIRFHATVPEKWYVVTRNLQRI
jgi:hypothetical protein